MIDIQRKNTLIDYLQEIINRNKVKASTSVNQIDLQVGSSTFTINTELNKDTSSRGVLSR